MSMWHWGSLAMAVALAPSPAPSPDFTCGATINNGRGLTKPNTGNHSNEARTISTSLWSDGTVTFKPDGPGCVDPDGTLGMKWQWWRGVRGPLTIEGRRLDGPAVPLRASVPQGYRSEGFQSTGLLFPTAGCWEVTGRVGGERLTFVTRVIKIHEGPATACRPLGIYERTPPTSP